MEFSGKVYLITGCNSGIGKLMSQMLIEKGAVVIGADINTDWMESLYKNDSIHFHYIQYDFSQLENIPAIFEYISSLNLKLDGLVHCAGISPLVTLADLDVNISIKTYNINVLSFIQMIHYFMIEKYSNDSSSIVGISSSTSVYGGNRQFLYSSTKAAMNLVVKSTAKELSSRNTRINTILPSITDTEMVAKLRKESDAIDINVKYKQPFGIIQPKDVCKCILFLLSSNSSAISGTNMKINNGESY